MVDAYVCLQRGQVTVVPENGGPPLPDLLPGAILPGALPGAFPDRLLTGGALFSDSPATIWNVPLPQRPQNFIPSANLDPHLMQATTRGPGAAPPVLLSRLPPREGVKWSLD